MDKQKRRPLVAGNWKMNLNRLQTTELINMIKPLCQDIDCDVVVAPTFVNLQTANGLIENSNLILAAQNCHWESKGAFTGEICADMLCDVGAKMVIIGHSERRQYFGETDKTVNQRLIAALKAGLKVILCVGETLSQNENNETTKVIHNQIKEALETVTIQQMENIIVAYEPVWAIGTGKTATPEIAGEVCGFIRGVLTGIYNMDTAYAVRILYGGSMNAANAKELLQQYDIDGGLIGSASLKAQDFAAIVAATC